MPNPEVESEHEINAQGLKNCLETLLRKVDSRGAAFDDKLGIKKGDGMIDELEMGEFIEELEDMGAVLQSSVRSQTIATTPRAFNDVINDFNRAIDMFDRDKNGAISPPEVQNPPQEQLINTNAFQFFR